MYRPKLPKVLHEVGVFHKLEFDMFMFIT